MQLFVSDTGFVHVVPMTVKSGTSVAHMRCEVSLGQWEYLMHLSVISRLSRLQERLANYAIKYRSEREGPRTK